MSGHGALAGTLRQQVTTVAMGALGVALVVVLWRSLPTLDAGATHVGRTTFGLGFLLLAGMAAGNLAALVRLPRLTGNLAAGILFGPHGLQLVGVDEVKALDMVNALALALIALQAGAEFTTAMLKRGFRSLAMASLTQLAIVGPASFLAFFALTEVLPFTQGVPWPARAAVALIWGAVSITKSPSVALAVIAETRSKGPVAEFTMGMVVLFDVVVLVVFAVALMSARVLLEPGAVFALRDFALLGEELVASVAAGTTLGLLVMAYFRGVKQERLLFVVVLAYGVTAFCAYFHYDTLLVFVIAGFVVQNLSRQGDALVHTVEKVSAAVMVIFFATAGAHLDVDALRTGWGAALGLAGVRAVFTWVACRAGHRLARDVPAVTRYGFSGLVSQAGVTIGLLTLGTRVLPDAMGQGLAALGIGVVAINELVGPVMFKWGLGRAGEIPDGNAPPPG
jgi:Kef-type K+ transport system membrane component KefB